MSDSRTLTNDSSIPLAFNVHESKGVFAVLIGSGLSRSAAIPTGWEITLDLIRRRALTEGVEGQHDWTSWYRDKTGEEPNYSTLLEELGTSPEERRSILHSYIEPTEEDRQEGRKVPTPAHHAIAELVSGGFIRVIVTTNFDRLMESALREKGIEPTVVASVDTLLGAEPITHSACYILKLHGDYKDARIRNTEVELSTYPPEYDKLLDRIFDEHGLIICGWSGEWDDALRAAFLRAPNRRYSIYWTARGQPAESAQELVKHRGARVVSITDADSFFTILHQRIETLQQDKSQNPLSVDLLVKSTKRFLSKSEYRIQLDELITQEAKRVVSQLDAADLSTDGPFDQSLFRAQIGTYEATTEALASMTGVLGRWGDGSEISLLLDIIQSLYMHAEEVGRGSLVYLNIRSYPAVLVFTAYALGLTRAERWGALHRFFTATMDQQYEEPARTIDVLFLFWKGHEPRIWKEIEGLEGRHTPLSDHLLALFAKWSKRFIGIAPNFELVFERFELLGSLTWLEAKNKIDIETGLEKDPERGWTDMPYGRLGWNAKNAKKLFSELQSDPWKSDLTQAGFANSDPDFINVFVQNFNLIVRNVRW